MGDYSDAAERANAIRYEAAEKLAATDWAAAEAAFEALGDYSDAADRARALRYNQAAQLAAAGQWREASDLYASLGDYSDAADKALQVKYQAAGKMAASQQWEEAVDLYAELGDYGDSAALIPATRYQQAAAVAETGDYLAAAALYRNLGSYRDAAAQVNAMYDRYYEGPATSIAQASENNDHAQVIQIMSWLDTAQMPEKYNYLYTLYQKACYHEGNRLFREKKPYEALVYYRQLPAGYSKDVDNKMQDPCYLILGTWEDLHGNRYIFREEGVCSLNGEKLFFSVDGNSVFTGAEKDGLTQTHRLNGVTRRNAWFYDQRGEKEITIYLTRVE
jgi:hypothetical protein